MHARCDAHVPETQITVISRPRDISKHSSGVRRTITSPWPNPLQHSLQRAREALARRDLAPAYEAALTALRADPRDAQAHALLGIVLSESNDLSSGEWHFRRALELAGAAGAMAGQSRDQSDPAGAGRRGRAVLCARRCALRRGTWRSWPSGPSCTRCRAICSAPTSCSIARGRVFVGARCRVAAGQYLVRRAGIRRRSRSWRRLPISTAMRNSNAAGSTSGSGRHREAWRDWVEGKAKLAAQAGGLDIRPTPWRRSLRA